MEYKYEGNSLKSGIYKITNKLNGKIYVGSAKEFKERWSCHASSLRHNRHRNKHLQESFNKYKAETGVESFLEFTVLEGMQGSTKEERLIREEYWISCLINEGVELYNSQLEPTKEPKTIKHKESTKRKGKTYEEIFGSEMALSIKKLQSQSRKTYFGSHPEAIISMKKRSVGKNNPFFGKTHTDETKTKISELQKGKTLEERCGEQVAKKIKIKMSEASKNHLNKYPSAKETLGNLIRGRTLEEIYGTEKAKNIKIKRSKGIAKTYTGFILMDTVGTIYTEIINMSAFCREHNLQQPHLLKLIKGKLKSHRGWKIAEQIIEKID